MNENTAVGQEVNIEICSNCKHEIPSDKCYVCDLCLSKIHKHCANLTPSEVKCLPLQKRTLLLVCIGCKSMLSRAPEIIRLCEEMKAEVIGLRSEVAELKNSISKDEKIHSALQCSYSEVLKGQNAGVTRIKSSSRPQTLVIKPPKDQDIQETKNELLRRINPVEFNIGIKNFKSTRNGNFIVKCADKQEIEKLKKAASDTLGGGYTVTVPKKNSESKGCEIYGN